MDTRLYAGFLYKNFSLRYTVEKEKIMKKIAVCTLLLAASTLLFACGPSNNTNENTDPEEVRSETLSKEDWQKAFKTQNDNFTVRSTLNMQNENEDTMSEFVTYIYSQRGNQATLQYCMKENGTCTAQGEAYLEYGEEVTMWQRGKEEEEDWSEWEQETYPLADIAFLGVMRGELGFLEGKYDRFSYNEADKGYSVQGENAESMAEDVIAHCAGFLGMLDGEPAFEKLTVKTQGKRPSACLFDFETSTAAEEVRISPRFRITHLRFDLPRMDMFGIRGVHPHFTLDMPLPIRTAAAAKKRFTIEQVYYNYGSTKVEKPSTLPAEGV